MKYQFKRDSPCECPYCIIGDYKYLICDYKGDIFQYRDYGPYKYALAYKKLQPHFEFNFDDDNEYNKWKETKGLSDNFYSNNGNVTVYLLYAKITGHKSGRFNMKALWKATITVTNEYIKDENEEIVDIKYHKSINVTQLHPLYLIRDDFLLYKECLDFAQLYLNQRYPEQNREQLQLF